MACDKCGSDRVFNIYAKSSDLNSYSFKGGPSKQGYAPDVEHICGGDDVDFSACLECGKIQGKFPVYSEELEEAADKGPYFFYAAESSEYPSRGYGGKAMVLVYITSEKYWDENHCVSDYHLHDELDGILPKGFAETSESCFESRYSLQRTKEILTDAGFVEDEDFAEHASKYDF